LLADDDFSDFVAHQIEITSGELKCGISTHVFYSKVKSRGLGELVAGGGTITSEAAWRRPSPFLIQFNNG
jgi:hypothetical protein